MMYAASQYMAIVRAYAHSFRYALSLLCIPQKSRIEFGQRFARTHVFIYVHTVKHV